MEYPLPKRWSIIVLPSASYNSTDRFGLGLAGEFSERPAGLGVGYRRKITVSSFVTLSLSYQSHYLQYETRGSDWNVLSLVGFRAWRNMAYAGSGGADVLLDWGAAEQGNRLVSPYGMVTVTHPVGALSIYGQLYLRWARVHPGEGSRLETLQPHASTGGFYGDGTLGVIRDRTNRWPLPSRGHILQADTRAGLSVLPDGRVSPLVGIHAEAIGWAPAIPKRLVFGGRLLAEKSFGKRPFFEQEFTGGRWRDELGLYQALTGYGRTRTRGDGVLAGLIEVRTALGRTRHPFWDLSFFLSAFAEEAWLFDGGTIGPHMPSIGFGPAILWQGASLLRPFVAWGWRADAPGDPRVPRVQFGLALTDSL